MVLQLGVDWKRDSGLFHKGASLPSTRPDEQDFISRLAATRRADATPLMFGCSSGSDVLPQHLRYKQDEKFPAGL